MRDLDSDFMNDPRLKSMDDSLDILFELTEPIVTSILAKEAQSRKSFVC